MYDCGPREGLQSTLVNMLKHGRALTDNNNVEPYIISDDAIHARWVKLEGMYNWNSMIYIIGKVHGDRVDGSKKWCLSTVFINP